MAFSRAAETYDENSKPQQELWQELLSLLEPFGQNYKLILDIGMGTGKNTYELAKLYPKSFVAGFDITRGMVDYAKRNWIVREDYPVFFQADLENIPFKEKTFDLVISNAVFQRIDNLKEAFRQVNRILKPKGIFCLSLFTERTLLELKSAFIEAYRNVKGSPIPSSDKHHSSLKVIKDLESAGFQIVKKIDFKKKQYYRNPEDIIRWLKVIGANRYFKNWLIGIGTRRILKEMYNIYKIRYSVDSGVYTTFEGLIIKVENR